MIDVDQLMQEYGVPPPFPEEFASNEEYVQACNLWLVGFEAYKQGRLSAMEAAADPPVVSKNGAFVTVMFIYLLE